MMVLCSVLAFGQGEPLWTVVKHVLLFNQNQAIPLTTLLTPTEPGIYRLNLYFQGGGGTSKFGNFIERLFATDITGYSLNGSGDFAVLWHDAEMAVASTRNDKLETKRTAQLQSRLL